MLMEGIASVSGSERRVVSRTGSANSEDIGSHRAPRIHIKPTAESDIDLAHSQLIQLKMSFAEFAMHVSASQRKIYFDRLDDIINFEEGDPKLKPEFESFRDFVRSVIFFKHRKMPILAINPDGVFASCWYSLSLIHI